MKMKSLLAAMAVAGTTLAFAGDTMAKTLRFAEFGPNRGTRAEALEWFADQVETRSDGALEIEFFWGKSLLGTKAVLQGVADGVADMGSIVGFLTPKELRAYNIGDLPVENSDAWIGLRALYGLATGNDALKTEFEEAGVTYITNYTTGPIQLVCTEPVETLEGLKGRKIRGSGPYAAALADLGAEVVSMAQTEVYQALDSGLVDCNQNYYYSIRAYKQYEVAPHVLELDWGQNMAFGIVMDTDTYQSLSDSERQVIDEVGSEFIDHFARVMIEQKAEDKAALVEGIDGNSVTVTTLPEEDRAKLLEAGRRQVDAWVETATAEGLDGAAILSDYEKRIEEHSAAKQSQGYPWER